MRREWGTCWSWIYDPRSGRFVENELTKELHELGIPNGGREIDPERHEMSYHYLPSVGAWAEGRNR
jgi:hypothetical protein